jgi:glyoxylase-like metal-dependent hydrolase (beta-lactamase superfamily II)
MTRLASGLDFVDLDFLGHPGIIATVVFQGAAGVALLDPGPSTTLETLRRGLKGRGISIADVRQVVLTHIHLDHAGAAGTLVKENPAIEVFVHERGAPHLVDPAKLLASAGRLYGADMNRLWGDFLPVPADRVHALKGGERIDVGGRQLEVLYTPGHASHHVSYFDRSSGVAFVGDTAGIRRRSREDEPSSSATERRRGDGSWVMPATPPPDIDLDVWRDSEARILAWDPDTLFLTHFGAFHGARVHFQQLRDHLDAWSAIVRRLISDAALDETAREQAFVDETLLALRRAIGEREAELYSRAGRLDYSWQGLARYWRKKAGS